VALILIVAIVAASAASSGSPASPPRSPRPLLRLHVMFVLSLSATPSRRPPKLIAREAAALRESSRRVGHYVMSSGFTGSSRGNRQKPLCECVRWLGTRRVTGRSGVRDPHVLEASDARSKLGGLVAPAVRGARLGCSCPAERSEPSARPVSAEVRASVVGAVSLHGRAAESNARCARLGPERAAPVETEPVDRSTGWWGSPRGRPRFNLVQNAPMTTLDPRDRAGPRPERGLRARARARHGHERLAGAQETPRLIPCICTLSLGCRCME